MTNPEFIQSAAQFAHQAKELVDLGSRTNLLQTLIERGHPYGLLLGNSGTSSFTDSSNGMANFLFPEKKADAIVDSKASNSLSDAGYLGDKTASKSCTVVSIPSGSVSALSLVVEELIENAASSLNVPSAVSSFITSSIAHRLIYPDRAIDEYDNFHNRYEYPNNNIRDQKFSVRLKRRLEFSSDNPEAPVILGLLLPALFKGSAKLLASNNEDFARKLHLEQLFAAQAVLAPGILKSLAELGERPRELWIRNNQMGIGSSSIHLGTYRGETPYLVKTPQGEVLTQINPGDQLGSVHVSGQAGLLRELSPMEKIQQITGDFIDLLKAVDNTDGADLNEHQQRTIDRAKSATIIGISHLVRLFGRKTGLPTWKLDVLPELVQRFHQHDSQIVSNTFGGKRKVKKEDIEMMFLTPEMRKALVA